MMFSGEALDHHSKSPSPGIKVEAKFDKLCVKNTHAAANTQVAFDSCHLVPQFHNGSPAVQDRHSIPEPLVCPKHLHQGLGLLFSTKWFDSAGIKFNM